MKATKRPNYTAHVRRVVRWEIDVRDVKGAVTLAKRLDQAEKKARKAIALRLDVPKDAFDVTVWPELPHEVETMLTEVAQANEALRSAEAAAAAAVQQATTVLTREHGLTTRDADALLGLSRKRIAELTDGAKERKTRRSATRR